MSVESFVVVLLLQAAAVSATVSESERADQNAIFQRSWDTPLVWKFADLPKAGGVSEERIPYSGHIYPDTAGGTVRTLRKYDAAFHGGRLLATAHEQWDTSAYQEPTMAPQRVGLFGARVRNVPTMRTPGWHGHCNGWTAASIRHAEPQHSVVRNGVTFTPADIKALLADIYMYSQYETLAGKNGPVNAGTLHVILANWLGRQSHPIGMEAFPGRQKWNYPIYAFESSSTQRGDGTVDVRTTIRYAYYSNGEYNRSPRLERTKYFHYSLTLNRQGEITGGNFYRDSSIIDLLWTPLEPVSGGRPGNERGNPHIDAEKVLAIWRDSVPAELLDNWPNIYSAKAQERLRQAVELTSQSAAENAAAESPH